MPMTPVIQLPYSNKTFPICVDTTKASLVIAVSRNPAASASWEQVVAGALAHPVDAPPLAQQDLRGKQVTVITDDWGRPTPAARVIPQILAELARAGATDDHITFVTASGMHDPMSRADIERKLGPDVVARHRCISHDGGDPDMLAFAGVSPMGTPVWINRHVAEADVRIGLGRVYLHVTHGYEGGYKLILPGVSSFETIVRDHALNFAETSIPGVHENPSRAETDQVGRMVGLDFLINVIVNDKGEPLKAFAGAVVPVHRRAIEYGDHEVWGAEVGHLADVTVVSHGDGEIDAQGFDGEALRRACTVTRPGGWVIVPVEHPIAALPDWRIGEQADDAALDRMPRAEFIGHLPGLSFAELMRLHERRNWPLPPREIQWRIKDIRGEYYRRRWMKLASERRVVFAPDPQQALDRALAEHAGVPHVVILPDARTTLPKLQLFRC